MKFSKKQNLPDLLSYFLLNFELCQFFRTSPLEKPFIWKWVCQWMRIKVHAVKPIFHHAMLEVAFHGEKFWQICKNHLVGYDLKSSKNERFLITITQLMTYQSFDSDAHTRYQHKPQTFAQWYNDVRYRVVVLHVEPHWLSWCFFCWLLW